jgi:PPOX class probable F420-dependent enzyme
MVEIPQSVRELVATGPLAHVVTLAPDGTPHVSLAWAGFEGDELIFATFFDTDQHKLRNLRRDPRVSLSFEAKEHTGEGLHPYVVIRGRATITGGALSHGSTRGAYIGPGATFPMRDVPPGVVVHVQIEKIYGQGPWNRDGLED